MIRVYQLVYELCQELGRNEGAGVRESDNCDIGHIIRMYPGDDQRFETYHLSELQALAILSCKYDVGCRRVTYA